MKKVKRIIIFGGTDASIYFIRKALKEGLEIILISDPFRLNSKLCDGKSLLQKVKELKISFFEVTEINVNFIKKFVDKFTIGISVVTFWIFKKEIINLFKGNLYNYHGAALPNEKGGGTFTWKILMNNRDGEINIHKITSNIDEGPIVLKKKFNYPENLNFPIEFENYRQKFEKQILEEFIELVSKEYPLLTYKQNDENSFYWPLLSTEENGVIDWSWKGEDIKIFIDAFGEPYQGASTLYNNKKVFLQNASIQNTKNKFHPFQYGLIVRKKNFSVYTCVKDGLLKVEIVKNEKGENVIDNLILGDRFHSPQDMVTSSMIIRPRYNFWGVKKNVLTDFRSNFDISRITNKNAKDILEASTIDIKNKFYHIIEKDYFDDLISNGINLKINLYIEFFVLKIRISDEIIGICKITSDFILKISNLEIYIREHHKNNKTLNELRSIFEQYICKIQKNKIKNYKFI